MTTLSRTTLSTLALVLLFGAGCRKGRPTTCKGWARYLKSPVRARDAIKNLGDLRCVDQISALTEVFPNSEFKIEIIQTIKAINAPKRSVKILTMALKDRRTATVAAAVAEDFAVPELRKPIIDILTTNKFLKARPNALKALAAIDRNDLRKDEDLLIKLLRTDPNVQRLKTNVIAARLLGQIRSQKAIPHLIVAMFVRSQRGGQMYTPVRKALAKIGPPAVAPLIAVLENDTEKAGQIIQDLQGLAKRQGMFDWQWREGPEMYQVLSDLGDPRAAEVFAAGLAKELVPPVGVDQRVLRLWQSIQQNRITMCMMGLWKVGSTDLIPKLTEVVLNPDNDAKQRLDTSSAIALLPGGVAAEAMLHIFAESREPHFRAPLVKPVSLSLDWDTLPKFKSLLARERSNLVLARVQGESPEAKEYQSFVSVLQDCKKADTDCLIAKLKGKDKKAAMKATILLSVTPGIDKKKALKALFEVYPQTDPGVDIDLRRFILLAIWRIGDKDSVAGLKRLLKSDKEHKGTGYWVDELETMIPAMTYRKTLSTP